MIVGRGWEEMRADPRDPIRATPPPEGPGALVLNVEAPSLGFDGGGVRGAFAAMLLDMVERAIQHRLGSSLPIGAYFQILAGTSTGAIIAGALASGMSAEKVSRFYQASGPSIFAKKRVPMLPGRKWRGIDDGAAYSAQPLEELLSDLIGGLQLSDLDYPLLATGYAMNSRGRRGPVIYYGGPGYCYPDDISLCDVIRSSTAAPTYFAPSEVEDTRGDVHMIVDGGLAANNPAYLGFLELKRRVRHLTPKPPIPPRYVILSIGTGADHNGRDPRVVRESPRASWLVPGPLFVVDQMMHAQSELVTHMLRMHDDVHHYRIEFNLQRAWAAMDDPRSIPDLHDMAERIATGNGVSNEEHLLTWKLQEFMRAFVNISPVAMPGNVPPLYS